MLQTTKEIEILVIETTEVTVVLKGKLDTRKHRSASGFIPMTFSTDAIDADVQIYHTEREQLTPFEPNTMAPIFFENGNYELIILPPPKTKDIFSFYHEYEPFRNAVTKLSRSDILTGNLHFRNEVGLSTMEIHKNGQKLFSFTIEVFPTKLDYQKDYTALLDEVNAEIYNLAFSFIRRTHLRASRKQYKEPSLTEFYRILREHFDEYIKAVNNVERFPHHRLVTTYEEVRGDRLRKQDSKGRAYLRKNAHRFVDVANGLPLANRTVMPEKGLLVKKQQTHDTHENRYVKWSMQRIRARVGHVKEEVLKSCKARKVNPDRALLQLLEHMEQRICVHLRKPLWKQVGQLDRSVYSLVMQMGTGYREVFQIYAILSQSLVLHGDIYKMSVKDIATLYEYWTFLKLGQILAKKCIGLEQDIVRVDRGGLYVSLKQNQTATRRFKHPITEEEVTLRYQYNTGNSLPTVRQNPDSMLSIAKKGKDYLFQYIFDAKYRINAEGQPGPMEEDINTMHRYRDSIVVKQGGKYERTAFGAYVLFPWNNEKEYRKHPLYESIGEVNIGGLPFLPHHTGLVEEVIDNLLHKNADELQREGILPRGAMSYLQEQEGTVLVVHERNIVNPEALVEDSVSTFITLENESLPEGYEAVKQIAIGKDQGVHTITNAQFIQSNATEVKFYLDHIESHTLLLKEPYEWVTPFIVDIESFDLADEFVELFVQGRELELLKMFRRISKDVQVQLDQHQITGTNRVVRFIVGDKAFALQEDALVCDGLEIAYAERPLYEIFERVTKILGISTLG
ncbi:restriction endonuclease-like protein [Lysinibacillus sp. 54212]|uniref:restriction endonuclease-like protein n=1 Tax=Lysinibacillus sp. 54212 TaxID=3119829 RepID=UPI002FC660F7